MATMTVTVEMEYNREVLVQARLRAKLTQERAAALAGIHEVSLNRIEKGVRGTSLKTLRKLCEIYLIDTSEVLTSSTNFFA